MTEAESKFLEGLKRLTCETGIAVSACSCCDGVNLIPVEDRESSYDVTEELIGDTTYVYDVRWGTK